MGQMKSSRGLLENGGNALAANTPSSRHAPLNRADALLRRGDSLDGWVEDDEPHARPDPRASAAC